MSYTLDPYNSVVPTLKEDVFDPFTNYWFQLSSTISFENFIELYKDNSTEYLLIDCSRSYPLSTDFGFLKDLIRSIIASKHMILYGFIADLQRIWTELITLEICEFEIRDKIYNFFERIELENRIVVFIFSDFHLIADNIHDKEIHILNRISSTNNFIKFWITSETKADSKNSKIRESFLNSFKVANDLQKNTFMKCAKKIIKRPSNLQLTSKVENMMGKIKLFISYAHDDELYKEGLIKLLEKMTLGGSIEEWNDRYIIPGKDWDNEIKKKLYESQIVLFLVSNNFLGSDYISDVEIKNTIDRYEQDQVLIISIILEECNFKDSTLSKFQSLPKDLVPISKWKPEINAWNDVLDGLKRSVDYLKNRNEELPDKIHELKNGAIIVNQGGANNINILNNSGPVNILR